MAGSEKNQAGRERKVVPSSGEEELGRGATDRSSSSGQSGRAARRSAEVLAALASEHRVRIVKRLLQKELSCIDPSECDLGERCCDVAELAKCVDCSLPTLSYHLKELKHAGIVVTERRGRHVFYALDRRTIRETFQYILEEAL